MKLARWYSIVDKLEVIVTWWWPYASMLILLSLQKGLFKNLEEVMAVAVRNYRCLQERVEELQTADGQGRGRMKDDGKGKSHEPVLHVAAATMAAPETLSLTAMIVSCLRVSRKEHGQAIVIYETRKGTLWRNAEMAAGQWRGWLNQLAMLLREPSTLRQAGISSLDGPCLWDMDLEQENMVAHYAWQLNINLLAVHTLSSLAYTWSFPMMVFTLVHENPEIQKEGLCHLREVWDTWQAAEAQQSSLVDEVLFNIIWTTHQWPRLLMLQLAECNFEYVPEPLLRELRETAQGPQTTKSTEDAFRDIRQQESSHVSNHISRCMRWHTLIESDVLRDADRPAPLCTQASKSLAQHVTLPADLFAAEGGESSLSEDFFKEVTKVPGLRTLNLNP